MIRDERGVSVAELILVIAIMGLIVSVLAMTIYQIINITGRGNDEMVVQHDLRNAATWLNRDVLSASKAVITQEADDYQMVLDVPYPYTRTTYITYTCYACIYIYDPEDEYGGDLVRISDSSTMTVARHIVSNPFPPPGTTLEARYDDVVTVTLRSREGNVPGSGTFALKMRAGGRITAMRLCPVSGADSLGFDGSTVSWVITNTGQTSPTIDEIYITWPYTNSALSAIWFDTSQIWAGLDNPITATISGGWLGDVESREIISGTQPTLDFIFESSAVISDTLYSITITLTDKCTVPFPPNP